MMMMMMTTPLTSYLAVLGLQGVFLSKVWVVGVQETHWLSQFVTGHSFVKCSNNNNIFFFKKLILLSSQITLPEILVRFSKKKKNLYLAKIPSSQVHIYLTNKGIKIIIKSSNVPANSHTVSYTHFAICHPYRMQFLTTRKKKKWEEKKNRISKFH